MKNNIIIDSIEMFLCAAISYICYVKFNVSIINTIIIDVIFYVVFRIVFKFILKFFKNQT